MLLLRLLKLDVVSGIDPYLVPVYSWGLVWIFKSCSHRASSSQIDTLVLVFMFFVVRMFFFLY